MTTVLPIIGIVAIGYLLGSIPTAYIVMYLSKKQDLRKLGTGNVTSTAVVIHGGKLPGALSLLGEIFKTLLCLFIAYLLVNELWAYLVMLVAAAVGEIWSIWLKGAGGRGQTIFVIGFLVLCPIPFLLAGLCFLLAFFTTKRLHLSNQIFHFVTPIMLMLANLFNPAMFGLGQHSWGYAVAGAVLCAIFVMKHRPETDDIIQSQAWGTYSR
ncbi:Glycerol-3-phosphate acyltransferase [subsurface metagenome]